MTSSEDFSSSFFTTVLYGISGKETIKYHWNDIYINVVGSTSEEALN